MAPFYISANFIVESSLKPFVSRTDGGHIRICVKDNNIADFTNLSPEMAIELTRLTMIVGEAMRRGMNERGIPVVKINYETLGNWAFKPGGGKEFLHVHIFGRASNSKKQPFPEAVYLPDRSTGFYDDFEPLTDDDEKAIRAHMEQLLSQEKYSDSSWGL